MKRADSQRCYAALLFAAATALALPAQAAPLSDDLLLSPATVGPVDPNRAQSGQNEVQSDLPAQFNGMNINTFLGANRFNAAGITGQGAIVTNVEAGHIWGGATGHETLTQVTTYITGTGSFG